LKLIKDVISAPNILWITIEDTSPQFIGCYGMKNARTPVIDRLGRGRCPVYQCFFPGTVCSPSRTAIITGVKTYKAGTGNHRSKYPVPDYIKGFPYYLQQQGYYTTNNVKTDYNVAGKGNLSLKPGTKAQATIRLVEPPTRAAVFRGIQLQRIAPVAHHDRNL
jgi:arylsulfatase A-like enzyme